MEQKCGQKCKEDGRKLPVFEVIYEKMEKSMKKRKMNKNYYINAKI